MSEFKGIGGPWRAVDSCVLYGDDQTLLACCEGFVAYGDHEIDYANARLIAAAPELLQALQEASSLISFLSNHLAGRMGDGALGDMEMRAMEWDELIAKALNTDTTER